MGTSISQSGIKMAVIMRYPLVLTNSLLLKMAMKIVGFTIKHGGSFHSYENVYQRARGYLSFTENRLSQNVAVVVHIRPLGGIPFIRTNPQT